MTSVGDAVTYEGHFFAGFELRDELLRRNRAQCNK